MHIIIWLELL